MRELSLVNGKGFALVDDEAFPLASHCGNWTVNRYGNVVQSRYAGILLHVLLYGKAPRGLDWDHINRNKLDNRRENLRIATRSQNKANCEKHRDGANPFKGICFDKSRRKWISKICVNGKQLNLGRFHNEKDAALAYDKAAKEYFGEFAVTNF